MCLGSIGLITETWETNGMPMAKLRVGEDRDVEICLIYTPDATVGSVVLAQLGFSVETLTPEAATEALRLREQAAETWEGMNGNRVDAPAAPLEHR